MIKAQALHLDLRSFIIFKLTNRHLFSQIELPGGGGFLVPKKKFEWAMRCRSDSLFCKDMVRMLWREPDLYHRSVTGQPCRRYQNRPKEGPDDESDLKRALTPEKFQAVKSKSRINDPSVPAPSRHFTF